MKIIIFFFALAISFSETKGIVTDKDFCEANEMLSAFFSSTEPKAFFKFFDDKTRNELFGGENPGPFMTQLAQAVINDNRNSIVRNDGFFRLREKNKLVVFVSIIENKTENEILEEKRWFIVRKVDESWLIASPFRSYEPALTQDFLSHFADPKAKIESE